MIRGTRFVPFAFVLEIRDHKWVVLQAAILGFAVFELLGLCARFVASVMDRMLFTSVTSSVREVLLQYRVWELYRALLYCMAAASAGWIVARVYRSRRTLAVASVVFVLGVSVLISLFWGLDTTFEISCSSRASR